MNWLWRLDESAYRAVHVDLRREWLDPWMVIVTSTGLGHVQGLVLAFAALFRPARPYALLAFASGAFTGLVRLGLMRYADRMRPSNFGFSSPLEQVYGNSSYPSGHASTSFAIAFALALAFRGTERSWIGWAAFCWACLVGLSRVYVGVHFPTDVLGGAGIGLAGAAAVYLAWDRWGWLPDAEREEGIRDACNEPAD